MKDFKVAIVSRGWFGGFPIKANPVSYKGKKVDSVQVKVKCPFCDNLIGTHFDLKECKCVFNPKIQRYEVTHSVHCCKCGNEVKNVTLVISRPKGWSVS